jgi:hypothetical protein
MSTPYEYECHGQEIQNLNANVSHIQKAFHLALYRLESHPLDSPLDLQRTCPEIDPLIILWAAVYDMW